MGNGQSSAPRQAAVSASGPYSEFAGFTYHERLARSEFDRMFPPLIYPGETPPNSTNRTLDSHDDAPAPVPAPPSPDPGQRKLFSSRKTRESQCVAAVLLENPPADQPSCSVCLTAFIPGDRVRLLKLCEHLFHDECATRWMIERKSQCPLCRYDYGIFRTEADGTIVNRIPKTRQQLQQEKQQQQRLSNAEAATPRNVATSPGADLTSASSLPLDASSEPASVAATTRPQLQQYEDSIRPASIVVPLSPPPSRSEKPSKDSSDGSICFGAFNFSTSKNSRGKKKAGK